MSTSSPYWTFSRAFVYSKDRAYVLAGLPELQDQQIDITQVIRWTSSWAGFQIDWPAVHLCVADDPELTLLCMGIYGRIHVATVSGFSEEEVDPSESGPASRGDLRDMRLIDGKVYVTGMGRQVYRREAPGTWRRLDEGVLVASGQSEVCGFNSIDGFSEKDIYAVGWEGEIWHYDGQVWEQLDNPTNLKLERVVCVATDTVYICGQCGTLLRYCAGRLEVIEHGVTERQFWGMEWFKDSLWIAVDNAIYKLNPDDSLINVDLGLGEEPVTCGWLHACSDLMWSVGGDHLFSTVDGTQWKLEVVP